MNLSLISTALLVSIAIASFTADDAKGMTAKNVSDGFHKLLKEVNPIELLAEFAGVHADDKELHKILKKATLSTSDHKKAKAVIATLDKSSKSKAARRVIFALPEDLLKEIGSDRITTTLKDHDRALVSYKNIPEGFFSQEDFIKALFANYKLADHCDIQKFFTMFSTDQFAKTMSKNPNFHNFTLTAESLNNLVEDLDDKKIKSFISNVTPKFLDSIYKIEDKVKKLNEDVVKALPKNFLEEIKYAPHPHDSQYYTEDQLRAIKDPRCKNLNLRKVPAKRMQYIRPSVIRSLKFLKDDQLSKLTAKQWNEILEKTDGCKLLQNGITLKNVSDINFDAKCFSKLGSDVQAYVLSRHDSLPNDILAYVTKDMVKEWQLGGVTGLNLISKCKNPKVLGHIGENVSDSKHPLKGATPEDLKKLNEHVHELSEGAIGLMKIRRPSSLAELRKNAEFVAALDDIYEIINKIEDKKRGGKAKDKKESKKNVSDIWSTLTASDIQRLMGPSYSKLPSTIEEEAYDKLTPEALAAISSNAIVQLRFFKDLNNEDYAAFNDTAFAHVSSSYIKTFHLGYLRDAQVPYISSAITDIKQSYFAVVKAQDLFALGEQRIALLTAPQLAALPPATIKAFITKEVIRIIAPAATVRFSKAQIEQIADEVIALISAEQASLMGSEIADAVAVLEARKGKMNAEARAALEKRAAIKVKAEKATDNTNAANAMLSGSSIIAASVATIFALFV